VTRASFDRIRVRVVSDDRPRVVSDTPSDRSGQQALWSGVHAPPSFGAVTIACSGCGATSVVGIRAAAKSALPSLHLPRFRRGYGSWMRCPACRRRTWVRLGIRL
jgi:hypothetical protein